MKILTLNCGSSSVKYQLYDWENKQVLATGMVERVTIGGSTITHRCGGRSDYMLQHECPTHTVAIELILKTLINSECSVVESYDEIAAVGHRMVHGGSRFARSMLIDEDFLTSFKDLADLAPLHNPANLMGVHAAMSVLPNIPHCAILDTAWHQTIPDFIYSYAIPRDWLYEYAVRRYGFHGTSFLYNAKRASVLLGQDPFKTNLIIAHIGNGASVNAVKNGLSYDTSMGMTPLEGLIMGTRSGDIDPGIIFHIIRKTGMTFAEVETALNKKSGILGITGKWADRRDVESAAERGDTLAILAQKAESYRIKKYIGAYMASLGRVDALVFTAGVGEMGPAIRKYATEDLSNIGIEIDEKKNEIARSRNAELDITGKNSKVKIFVIPTDEELVMTEDTVAITKGEYNLHTKYRYYFQNKGYVNLSRSDGLERDIAKRPYIKEIIAKPRD